MTDIKTPQNATDTAVKLVSTWRKQLLSIIYDPAISPAAADVLLSDLLRQGQTGDGAEMEANARKQSEKLLTQIEASDLPIGSETSLADKLGLMMQEAHKKKPKLSKTERITFLHTIRMELSRHELEEPILHLVNAEIDRLTTISATMSGIRQTEGKFRHPDHINSKIEKGTISDLSPDYKDALLTNVTGVIDIVERERFCWQKLLESLTETVINTNDGLHIMQTDVSRVRKIHGKSNRTIRLVENLTDIWVNHIDPELGLPNTDGRKTNPYSRFINFGLSAADEPTMKTSAIVNLALKHFRRRIRANETKM